ncbi:MAG: hypothetical protein H6753_00980 [Candidatus Omnitrophica bacterium]|nr:hypothetical protein [Candidatus Omnitrophota bacterium]
MNEIYEFITSRGELSSEHLQELKSKRGFSEEVIKSHRFFSGGKYLLTLENELLSNFSEDNLLVSGVFHKYEGFDKIIISSQLSDDRIIIPYLDKENKAYFLRPHKMGLKIPIQIYHEKVFNDPTPGAILTESEFKAVAGHVWGIKTIGVPGISSFVDTHFKNLVKFIQAAGIKQICILFDNEIKDDPAFPNYKEDPFKRYDTEYFSFILAKNLNTEGIDTRIGRLPDSWRVNGKIDLDGALAQGKTSGEIKQVISESKNPKAFVQDLPQEVQNIINRKQAKKYHRTHITVEFGKYVASRKQGKQEWQETISDFTLKIIARHETMEGVIREIVIVDQFGKHSHSFPLPSEPMVKNDAFANFVMNKGNYTWLGSIEDLKIIWQSLFLEDDGRHIIEPDCVGWLPDGKFWVFGNVVFSEQGELRHDEKGIFWIKNCGYKPVPLSISSGKSVIAEGIPYLNMNKCDFGLLRAKFAESIGDFVATICLGWACGVLFMDEVFKKYGCFPFLFITGRRGSGKSTVAEWIMNSFGMENAGKQAADTTAVAIQRYLSYYSSLPFFIDEYRNIDKVTSKNGFLRNAYNRQSAGKGMRQEFGIREGKVRGTLIIAGEETPSDNALLTRCVVVQVSEKNRRVNNFDWFVKQRDQLSAFAYQILRNRKQYCETFLSQLVEDKEAIAKLTGDDRLATNMAVASAGAFTLFGENTDFAKMFKEGLLVVKAEQESENAVAMFFKDIQALAFNESAKMESYWDVKEGKIYLYFHGLYNLYAKEYQSRNREAPFKEAAIRNYLKDEPGFVGVSVDHRLKKVNCSCVVFSIDACPGFIRDLVGDIVGDSAPTES